jgi:branched-chain amino acid transport system substrate-binding protein
MKYLRTFVFIALLLAVTAPLNGCTGAVTPTVSASIKIGGGFDLTGPESLLDLPAANGAKLAAKEINAAGGVFGRPLELIVRDSKYDKVVTAQITQQFVNEDKVSAVIGFSDTDSALVAGSVTQPAGLPFIAVGATSPKIPSQVGDLVFLACFGDNVQAAAGAEFAFKTYGPTAYLLWNNDVEYTTLLARYFNIRFTELGGAIVLADSYPDQTVDFSAQIAKVKALPKQPDFYYVAAMPYNIGPLVKQFRAAGLTGPIIGGDGYDTPDLIGVAGPAAGNVFFTTHALMDPVNGTDGIQKFAAAYQAEYGRYPENAFAALGYDTIYLLADAIQRAGATGALAIKRALEETRNFPGITGSITLGPDSHVPRKGVTIIAVKNGRFTLGAEIVPDKVPAP